MVTRSHAALFAFLAALLLPASVLAANYTVTSPTFDIVVGGPQGTFSNGQGLGLTIGQTYTFQISTSSLHPVAFQSTNAVGGPWYAGATPVGATSNGLVTLTIPPNPPPSSPALWVICSVHGDFVPIIPVPAPATPAFSRGASALFASMLLGLGIYFARQQRARATARAA